jgi:hypothetical protein
MRKINLEVKKNLENKGIVFPEKVSKKEFVTLIYIIKDPLTDETLKEIKMTEKEFLDLPYYERKKFKNLELKKEFNENEYEEANKKYLELVKKYNAEYNKEYKKIIKKYNITEKEIKQISEIFDIMDLDKYISDEEIIEKEEELLSVLRMK